MIGSVNRFFRLFRPNGKVGARSGMAFRDVTVNDYLCLVIE
jgi:hypothetical protein